jgi:hypothetical protein
MQLNVRTGLRRIGAIGLCVVAAGCATPVTQRVAVDSASRAQEERTQQRLALKAAFDLEMRLYTVGYGVLKGAAGECGANVRQSLGFFPLSTGRLKESNRDLAASAVGVDSTVKVFAVYKGSAADVAGLKVGDIIPNATSSALTPVGGGETREAASRRLPDGLPLTLNVLRDGAPLTLTMMPDAVCDYPLRVAPGNEVNAYADGKGIFVTRGMMRFATQDKELALVIGHELGHNTMGHTDKKKTNSALGAVVDILAAAKGINTQSAFMKAGATAYSQDFEAEADYVGLYYLARAGYDTSGAADFWRRMATEYPSSIKNSHSATHPATAERFLALEKVGEEIRQKQSDHMELTPNRVK